MVWSNQLTHPAHKKILLIEMSSVHLGSVSPWSFYLDTDLLSLFGTVNLLLVVLDASEDSQEDELLPRDTDGSASPTDPGLNLHPHSDGVPPGEDVLGQDPQLAGKDSYGAELFLLLSDELRLVLSEPDNNNISLTTSDLNIDVQPRSHLSNRW